MIILASNMIRICIRQASIQLYYLERPTSFRTNLMSLHTKRLLYNHLVSQGEMVLFAFLAVGLLSMLLLLFCDQTTFYLATHRIAYSRFVDELQTNHFT